MTALDLIGVPYVSKGRDLNGLDCWGVVYRYYSDVLGIKIPEYADAYSDSAEQEETARAILNGRQSWVEVAPPKPGDVVLLRIMREPTHVGIYVDGHRVLHVRKGANTCIERLDGPFWRSRIAGFFRYVG